MAEGLKWDDFDEALAAVRDIGQAAIIRHPHTQEKFQQAFFMPRQVRLHLFEQWVVKVQGCHRTGAGNREIDAGTAAGSRRWTRPPTRRFATISPAAT